MHWQACDVIDRLGSELRTGLIFIDEYGHRRDYSFAEVAKYSLRYAAVLRAFGVHEQDRVYVHLPATAKCVFALLALQRLGARALLDEADAAGATAIISNRKFRAHIDRTRDRFAADARYLIIGEESDGWARLDTLAQVASTNLVERSAIETGALDEPQAAAQQELGAVATDVVWYAVPSEDGAWFDRGIVRAWLCGSAAVLHDGGFDARERLDLVRELDVTIVLQPSEEYHAELALPDPKRFKMPRLRRCIAIADGFDEVLQAQWLQRFGVPLVPHSAPSSRLP